MIILGENKKAYFNYQILEKFEAGIVLNGQEVKSIKTKGINLAGSYIIVKEKEVFWIGSKIPPYQPKNITSNYNPERSRKLLLKKAEIKYLIGKSKQKGLTLLPLKIYTINNKIKIEFAIVKSRKKFNKKDILKQRVIERDTKREIKEKIETGG